MNPQILGQGGSGQYESTDSMAICLQTTALEQSLRHSGSGQYESTDSWTQWVRSIRIHRFLDRVGQVNTNPQIQLQSVCKLCRDLGQIGPGQYESTDSMAI